MGPRDSLPELLATLAEQLCLAHTCIERRQADRECHLLDGARALLAQIQGRFNRERCTPIARSLTELCDYIMRRLTNTEREYDAPAVSEALGLIEEVRGAWPAIGPQMRTSDTLQASAA